MSEIPWLTVLSGFSGVLIGALLNAYLRHRSERKAARQELLGLIGKFSEETIAAITEIYATVLAGSPTIERWKARAQFQRQNVVGVVIETRIFREFRSRKVRAGFHKVLSRIDVFKDFVDAEKAISEKEFELGVEWIRKQVSDTISFAACPAGVSLTDNKRIAFVRFGRYTREDVIPFQFDDRPPPWKFDFSVEIEGLNEESRRAATAANSPKVEKMLCPVHGRPAHVVLHGKSGRNFSVEIDGCCKEFIQSVHDKLSPGSKGKGDVISTSKGR